jgi:hypothetical protein
MACERRRRSGTSPTSVNSPEMSQAWLRRHHAGWFENTSVAQPDHAYRPAGGGPSRTSSFRRLPSLTLSGSLPGPRTPPGCHSRLYRKHSISQVVGRLRPGHSIPVLHPYAHQDHHTILIAGRRELTGFGTGHTVPTPLWVHSSAACACGQLPSETAA